MRVLGYCVIAVVCLYWLSSCSSQPTSFQEKLPPDASDAAWVNAGSSVSSDDIVVSLVVLSVSGDRAEAYFVATSSTISDQEAQYVCDLVVNGALEYAITIKAKDDENIAFKLLRPRNGGSREATAKLVGRRHENASDQVLIKQLYYIPVSREAASLNNMTNVAATAVPETGLAGGIARWDGKRIPSGRRIQFRVLNQVPVVR